MHASLALFATVTHVWRPCDARGNAATSGNMREEVHCRRSHRCSGCLQPGAFSCPAPLPPPLFAKSAASPQPKSSGVHTVSSSPGGAMACSSGLQQQRHIRRASWTTYVDVNAFDHVPWSRAWKRAWLMRVSLAGGRSRQHGVWTWSGGGEGSGGDMPQLRCGGASLVRADRPFPKHTRAGAAALGLSTGSAQGAPTRGGLGPPSHDNWQHKRI